MEQIAVTKITKTSGGEQRRHMMLPKNIWEDLVKNGSQNSNVTWELRQVEKVAMKETKIIKNDAKEVVIEATETETTESGNEEEATDESAEPAQVEPKKKVYKKRK